MKVAFYTLGCKVNQYDSQEMISLFKSNGYIVVDAKESADIYIINSCTVTSESSRKSRQAARRFRNAHPDAIIVITGCYTQAFIDEFKDFPDVDIDYSDRDKAKDFIKGLELSTSEKWEAIVCNSNKGRNKISNIIRYIKYSR